MCHMPRAVVTLKISPEGFGFVWAGSVCFFGEEGTSSCISLWTSEIRKMDIEYQKTINVNSESREDTKWNTLWKCQTDVNRTPEIGNQISENKNRQIDETDVNRKPEIGNLLKTKIDRSTNDKLKHEFWMYQKSENRNWESQFENLKNYKTEIKWKTIGDGSLLMFSQCFSILFGSVPRFCRSLLT